MMARRKGDRQKQSGDGGVIVKELECKEHNGLVPVELFKLRIYNILEREETDYRRTIIGV